VRIFRIAIPASDIERSREFYEALLSIAVAAGALEVSSIKQRPWGERSFYCLDPDGNRLCFVDDSTLFLGRGAAWS
jgi:catechol 2,3-dioxygenase-like lactoylglutathione lyase family enzyme